MPLLLLLVFGLVVFLPGFWVKRQLKRHDVVDEQLQGTGEELAQHLIERLQLDDCSLELGDWPDHFDPSENVVRLNQKRAQQKSVSSVAIAAHEVGHAMQFYLNLPALGLRTRLAQIAAGTQKVSALATWGIPLLSLTPIGPVYWRFAIIILVANLLLGLIFALITLPVEFDASYKRALPILKQGYLNDRQLKSARQVLSAAAYTYVAAALSNFLNIAYWFRLLRR